jgi:cation diffusion facilitator family transporter
MLRNTSTRQLIMTTSEGSESTSTVGFALGVNLTIAVAKATVGVLSGSPAILSEAAHSMVDTSTQVLLLVGLHRAKHPERPNAEYAWGCTAAVSMFATGACYAAYEGLVTLLDPPAAEGLVWLAVAVLVVSAGMEATSWVTAFRQLWRGRGDLSLWAYLRVTPDTSAKAVLLEDTADIAGCALALAGVVLRAVTGSAVWDAVASLLIAGLITVVAWQLGTHNLRLLRVGQPTATELPATVCVS